MELALGTVQFGMQYGVASQGRPARADALEMMAYAVGNGVTTLDTAAGYGEAEEVVGAFLRTVERGSVEVVTKIRPGALDGSPPERYIGALRDELTGSLSRLGTDYVDVCLFHNAQYAGDGAALPALSELKSSGRVRKTGVSIYTPGEFEQAAASPFVDVIQIPYNILDTRLDDRLADCGKEIHARSAYLQGLLLMGRDEIPSSLAAARPYLARIDQFCAYFGLTRTQALLGFVKTQPNIHKLLVGADNMAQLRQTVRDFAKHTDGPALRELAAEFKGIDEKLIMPNLWRKE